MSLSVHCCCLNVAWGFKYNGLPSTIMLRNVVPNAAKAVSLSSQTISDLQTSNKTSPTIYSPPDSISLTNPKDVKEVHRTF